MDRGERNLHSLESDVSEVTTLLRNNVEKVIARGEKIDDLQDRSQELEAGSVQFKKSARDIKKKMCCQNCRMMCVIGVVVATVIAVIVVIILVELKPWQNASSRHHNHTLAYGT